MKHSPFTRRNFLRAGSAATAASLWMSRRMWAASSDIRADAGHVLVPRAGRFEDFDFVGLAARATEAAISAGAQYADTRLSLTQSETWDAMGNMKPFRFGEERGVGVRALCNGYWGFFGGTAWTPDEMVRLGRGAVAQAKSNALGKTRDTPLGTIPRVPNGAWTMPVKYDPFSITLAEKADYMAMMSGVIHRMSPLYSGKLVANFQRTTKVFASSEGSAWTQTTYVTQGMLKVNYGAQPGEGKYGAGGASADTLTPAGQGWEYVCESGLIDQLPALLATAEQARAVVPVDVGRYDVVCAPVAVAAILSASIGAATELDRAMGYEANASGTSYLDDPLAMLGTYHVGSPLVNVTANRSHPGGAATVKWDDEAVVPDDFTLVKDGVLADYQTTREQAAWLAPYYNKTSAPIRSHGCASTQSALNVTLQNAPNLQLMPGAHPTSFDDLVAGTEKGVALMNVSVHMDAQQLNGLVLGTMREITKGKLGRFILGGALDFRAPEFWKSLSALGGPHTTRWFGQQTEKGEPAQYHYHSVGAVPAKFQNAAIIDFMRKA